MPAAKAGARKGPTRPAKPRAKRTSRIEVPTGRLDLSFKAGTPRGSRVRYNFLLKLGKASGLSVAEARRGMNGIRDTLLENLKANRYSRIPELLLFHGVMQRPTRPAVTVIFGKARVFAARTVFKKKVKGAVLKPLREAFA